MRETIEKSGAIRARLEELRHTLAGLLFDARFVRALSLEGINTLPEEAFERGTALQEKARLFQSQLRDRAAELISGKNLARRTRRLLDKMTPARRIEVAEIMVLANDTTEGHARALVLATPENELIEPPQRHIDSARRRELERMADESAFTYREAKRSLECLGHDALALLALTAYVWRLLAMPAIVAWLERHDKEALRALKYPGQLEGNRAKVSG